MSSTATRLIVVPLVCFLLMASLGTASAYPRSGSTTRVTVGWKGEQGPSSLPEELPVYNFCCWADISANSRFVVFSSDASNLVPGDHNEATDVFVRDLETRRTTRVSVSSDGDEAVGLCVAKQQGTAAEEARREPISSGSGDPSISADGRFVQFASCGSNLVPGDTNAATDIFVHDRVTHRTRRVSVSTAGEQTPPDVSTPQLRSRSLNCAGEISASGRYATFSSYASNLVANDTNDLRDVFVHDLKRGATARVSVSSKGEEGTAGGGFEAAGCGPTISDSGRYVAFSSGLKGLVPNDTNGNNDAFVHDRVTHRTVRVSVDSAGDQADLPLHPNLPAVYGTVAISGNGRFVAFDDLAPDLVPQDTNDGSDVFVHDLATRRTQRVSVTSTGDEFRILPTEWMLSTAQSISNDGRYVGYTLAMMRYFLPPDDDPLQWGNYYDDIRPYLYDRISGENELLAVNSAGRKANGVSGGAITVNGRHVLFYSEADNLVPDDRNHRGDFFLRDRGAEVHSARWTIRRKPSKAGGGAAGALPATPVGSPSVKRGSVVARPGLEDLFVRLQLGRDRPAGEPVESFELLRVATDSGDYVVRLSAAPEAAQEGTVFALYRCTAGLCSGITRLAGGYGTTGNEIAFSIPFQALAISGSAGIRNVE